MDWIGSISENVIQKPIVKNDLLIWVGRAFELTSLRAAQHPEDNLSGAL